MTAFNDALTKADASRNRWRCRRAAREYKFALAVAVSEDEQCQALHMLGVTYKMWGRLRKAQEALDSAFKYAEDDIRRGNILRDLADTLSLMDYKNLAFHVINRSIAFLDSSSVAYAASVGFKGRVLQRAGDIDAAVKYFRDADNRLKNAGAQRLFNYLPYTNAVLQQGAVLDDAWWREAQQLVDEHGAWIHRLRLIALRRFGYRADNIIQRLLPLQRFVPFL